MNCPKSSRRIKMDLALHVNVNESLEYHSLPRCSRLCRGSTILIATKERKKHKSVVEATKGTTRARKRSLKLPKVMHFNRRLLLVIMYMTVSPLITFLKSQQEKAPNQR